MTGGFEIRRATERDAPHVLRLVSEMIGGDASERYSWLYRGNPHGVARTWLASDGEDGAPVGVTSIFPREVLVEGQRRVGGIGGDCYVAPRARRRGLATHLHRASFADMREDGVDFMYGPPLPHNLGALLKAGTHQVGLFKRWVRPLRMTPESPSPGAAGRLLGAAVGKVLDRATRPALRGVQLERLERIDDEWDHWSLRMAARYPVFCKRDAQFLHWRYGTSEQRCYGIRRHGALCGLVVVEHRGEVTRIVDLCAEPDVIDGALWLAIRTAPNEATRIEIALSDGSPDAQHLLARGFIPREGRVFQVAVTDGDAQIARLTRPSGWHFTDGDKDSRTVYSPIPIS